MFGWYNAAGTQRRHMGMPMPDDNQRFRAEAIGVEAEALINRLRDCIVETFPEPAGDTHYVVRASLSAVMARFSIMSIPRQKLGYWRGCALKLVKIFMKLLRASVSRDAE